MAGKQKITIATSRAYRRLYGPADLAFRRVALRFAKKNRNKIVNKFYTLFLPQVKRQVAAEQKVKKRLAWIVKGTVEVKFDDYIGEGLDGNFAFDPIVITFTEEAAAHVMEILGEELTMFTKSGEITTAWMREHGLDMAKSVSGSMAETLRVSLAEGLRLRESPMKLKERLRKKLKGWEEYKLNRLARTEAKNSLNEGALAAYEASNVINGKMWIAHAGACEICVGLNGERRYLDQPFHTGHMRPVAHSNGRCSIGGVRLPPRGKDKKKLPSQIKQPKPKERPPKDELPKPKKEDEE